MPNYYNYETPREICYKIKDIALSKGVKLTARPWNKNKPDETDWWLIPSTDWPAFKYGKFFFTWNPELKDKLYFGYYIEKGLDRTIKEAYPSRKGSQYIMDKDWAWFRFLNGLSSDKIKNIINKLNNDSSFPVELIIDGGNVPDPESFDPFAPRIIGWDKCILKLSQNSNNLELLESQLEAHLLTELTTTSDLNKLADIINRLNENKWLWIDFFIASKLHILPTKDNENKPNRQIDVEMIWDKFLSPFLEWVN
jgi:hypothetical protein